MSNTFSHNAITVARLCERENSGIRALSLERIAIGYILSGTKYLHRNDTFHQIDEGDLFILDSGFHYEENKVGNNGRYEQVAFYLSAEALQQTMCVLRRDYGLSFTSHHNCQRCSSLNFVTASADTTLSNFFQGVNHSLRSTGQLHNDVGLYLKLNELLYLLLAGEDGCVRRRLVRSTDATTIHFVNTIYGNIFNDISIEELAEQTNRSLTSFKKEFRRLFSASPHQWIIEKRLDRARLLLGISSRTVSEIGVECGFTNISHFIKLFKQRYQSTPASFRKTNYNRSYEITRRL